VQTVSSLTRRHPNRNGSGRYSVWKGIIARPNEQEFLLRISVLPKRKPGSHSEGMHSCGGAGCATLIPPIEAQWRSAGEKLAGLWTITSIRAAAGWGPDDPVLLALAERSGVMHVPSIGDHLAHGTGWTCRSRWRRWKTPPSMRPTI